MELVWKLDLLSNHAVVFNPCFTLQINETAKLGKDAFIHTFRFRK